MSIKSILAVVGSGKVDSQSRAIIDFSRELHSHLTALKLCITSRPLLQSRMAVSMVWMRDQQRVLDVHEAQTRELRGVLSGSGVEFTLLDAYTSRREAVERVAELSMCCDLVLVEARAAAQAGILDAVLKGTLFLSPSPLMLSHAAKPLVGKQGVVMLAWDESGAAARAIRSSLDFLRAANHVTIVTVDAVASGNTDPGAALSRYLDRHGVAAEIRRVASGDRDVATTLSECAADLDASLVVMGAYGHSRIGEELFGGTTRSMIETQDFPLYLSH